MSVARCRICDCDIEDKKAIFCGVCGSTLKVEKKKDVSDNNTPFISRLIGVLLMMILVWSVMTFMIVPILISWEPERTGQFILIEDDWSALVTDYLIVQPTDTWIRAGREIIVKSHHLNESDPYLVSITEYTQKTMVVAQRWYNVTGTVNHTISYYASDFVYLVNNGGNISFILYRGTWMNYTDSNGTWRIINNNDLQCIATCYIIHS